jgi:hypothetical protein
LRTIGGDHGALLLNRFLCKATRQKTEKIVMMMML